MTEGNIPVRKWQELFRAGAFHKDGYRAPYQAGWDDF